MNGEKLISESVVPVFADAVDSTVVPAGEPLVPRAFVWRGATYPVLRVLESNRSLGPCTHGSGERYVRRHWYRIASTGGMVLQLYFERRPRRGGQPTKRWWLYSVATAESVAPNADLDPN